MKESTHSSGEGAKSTAMPSPKHRGSGSTHTGPHKRTSRPSLEDIAAVTNSPSRRVEHEQYGPMQETSAALRNEEKRDWTKDSPVRARGDH